MRIVNEADESEYRRYKCMKYNKTYIIYFTLMISLPSGNEIPNSKMPVFSRHSDYNKVLLIAI